MEARAVLTEMEDRFPPVTPSPEDSIEKILKIPSFTESVKSSMPTSPSSEIKPERIVIDDVEDASREDPIHIDSSASSTQKSDKSFSSSDFNILCRECTWQFYSEEATMKEFFKILSADLAKELMHLKTCSKTCLNI